MTPPAPKLKPCPFCGNSHAIILKSMRDSDTDPQLYQIYLGSYYETKCKLHGFGMARYANEADAAKDWNTRAGEKA